jgi:hypothetical protein
VGFYHWLEVRPIGGLTAKFNCPIRSSSSASSASLPAMTARQYEVYNPGPGAFSAIQLLIMLPNRFVSTTAPPAGLEILPVGDGVVTFEPMGNSYTRCKVIPLVGASDSSLDVGGSFGVRILSDSENWSPDGQPEIDYSGRSIFINADQWLVTSSESSFLFGFMMTVSLLILLSAASTLYVFMFWIPKLRVQIRSEISAESQAVGMNKANEDLGEVTVPDTNAVAAALKGMLGLLGKNPPSDSDAQAPKRTPNNRTPKKPKPK